MSKTGQILNGLSNQRTARALINLFGDNAPEIINTLFDYSNGEIGTASGGGLSPSVWSTCPRGLMLVDPTVGHFLGDDFQVVLPTAYGYTLVGTNGTFPKLAGDANGVGVLTTGATDNDEGYLTSANNAGGLIKADATTNWWFEARVKVSQITLEQGVFVGLAEEAGVGADFMTDNTMALKVVDYLGFQVIRATAGAAIWQSVMALNGGARVALNATLATASTDWVKLGMKSESGTITFYVDGVVNSTVTTSAATNFPLNQIMQATFGTKTGKAAANTLSVDWWYAAQLR